MKNWCNCNWIWFSICCRNCKWIFAVIEFNYSQLLSITTLICISIFFQILRLRLPLAISCAATTPVEISVLISNCPLWFTPLPLWANDCNEQTLPAASGCLISLILYTMGGFLTVDTCPFIPQDKANLSHGPTKLDRQPTICHGLERWKPSRSSCFTN